MKNYKNTSFMDSMPSSTSQGRSQREPSGHTLSDLGARGASGLSRPRGTRLASSKCDVPVCQRDWRDLQCR